jgi:hypothetical protein
MSKYTQFLEKVITAPARQAARITAAPRARIAQIQQRQAGLETPEQFEARTQALAAARFAPLAAAIRAEFGARVPREVSLAQESVAARGFGLGGLAQRARRRARGRVGREEARELEQRRAQTLSDVINEELRKLAIEREAQG